MTSRRCFTTQKRTIHRLRPGQYKLPVQKPKLEFTGNSKYAFKGKWINASLLDYKSPYSSEIKQFETVGRPLFVNTSSLEYNVAPLDQIYGGVDVIPLSKCPRSGDKIILLLAIYRIPVQRYVLSFPAGFQDSKEDPPETTALRELKEEAGYHGSNPQVSHRHWTDPWKSCDRSVF